MNRAYETVDSYFLLVLAVFYRYIQSQAASRQIEMEEGRFGEVLVVGRVVGGVEAYSNMAKTTEEPQNNQPASHSTAC